MRKALRVLIAAMLLVAISGTIVYLRPEIVPPGWFHPRYIAHEIKGDRIHPWIATDPGTMYSIILWDSRWPVFRKELYNYEEFMDYVVQGFAAVHPNVRIEVRLFDMTMEGEELRRAIEAGERPDVLAGTFDPQFASAGLLVDLSPFFDETEAARFAPAALEQMTMDGKTYAYPRWFEPQYMIANATALARAGVDIEAIRAYGWTWRDVEAVGPRFKGTNVVPLVLDSTDVQAFETLVRSTGGGGAFDASGNLIWSERDLASLVSVVAGLVKQGTLPSPPSRYRTSSVELFWSGKVALMGPASSGFLRYMRERAAGAIRLPGGEKSTPEFDVAVLPLPHQAEQGTVLGNISSLMVFDQGDRERARIAVELARFLAAWSPSKITDNLQLVSCHAGSMDRSVAGLFVKTGTSWISDALTCGVVLPAAGGPALDTRSSAGAARIAKAVRAFWDRPVAVDKLVQSLHKAMAEIPPAPKAKTSK
ncbi:MAG: extracellular solute-binding protein [Bacillota bacterium]|nr:extracellular solute-binding protein [Bacillota bacterium]